MQTDWWERRTQTILNVPDAFGTRVVQVGNAIFDLDRTRHSTHICVYLVFSPVNNAKQIDWSALD